MYSDEQFQWLDAKCAGLVNNYCARNDLAADPVGFFLISPSLPCSNFNLENAFNVCFVNVLECCIFAQNTFGASPAFKNVESQWEGRVFLYDNEALIRNSSYKHMAAILRGFAFNAKYTKILIQKQSVAT